MQISIQHDLRRAAKDVRALGKQGSFAMVAALSRTASYVRSAEQQEMRSVFDRPTQYTLNSLYVKSASKAAPEASVGLKDGAASLGRGVPGAKVLAAEIDSGDRRLKSFEKQLQAAGAMPNGWRAVPGKYVQLDDAGNLPRSILYNILAQLRSGGLVFPTQDDAKARGNIKRRVTRAGGAYFALPKGRGKLPPGIYISRRSSFGSAIELIVLFVPAVHYRRRFDFFGIASRDAEKFFPVYLAEAIDEFVDAPA